MATTKFESIYDRFLSKIHDYELSELVTSDLEIELHKYLKSSIAEFKYCEQDLSNRDNDNAAFNIELTELEQEILAKFMIIQWLNPRLYREESLRNVIGNRDYNTFSPANLLDKIANLKKELIAEVHSDMAFYYYSTT